MLQDSINLAKSAERGQVEGLTEKKSVDQHSLKNKDDRQKRFNQNVDFRRQLNIIKNQNMNQ